MIRVIILAIILVLGINLINSYFGEPEEIKVTREMATICSYSDDICD